MGLEKLSLDILATKIPGTEYLTKPMCAPFLRKHIFRRGPYVFIDPSQISALLF